MGIGGKWENSVLSTKFCYEPKIALKHRVYFNNYNWNQSWKSVQIVQPVLKYVSADSHYLWRKNCFKNVYTAEKPQAKSRRKIAFVTVETGDTVN